MTEPSDYVGTYDTTGVAGGEHQDLTKVTNAFMTATDQWSANLHPVDYVPAPVFTAPEGTVILTPETAYPVEAQESAPEPEAEVVEPEAELEVEPEIVEPEPEPEVEPEAEPEPEAAPEAEPEAEEEASEPEVLAFESEGAPASSSATPSRTARRK